VKNIERKILEFLHCAPSQIFKSTVNHEIKLSSIKLEASLAAFFDRLIDKYKKFQVVLRDTF